MWNGRQGLKVSLHYTAFHSGLPPQSIAAEPELVGADTVFCLAPALATETEMLNGNNLLVKASTLRTAFHSDLFAV